MEDKWNRSKGYKAKIVVTEFQPEEEVYCKKIFSLVVRLRTVQMLLHIGASEVLHLKQLHIHIPFLHEDLEDDIYMTQPEGF